MRNSGRDKTLKKKRRLETAAIWTDRQPVKTKHQPATTTTSRAKLKATISKKKHKKGTTKRGPMPKRESTDKRKKGGRTLIHGAE